MTTSTRIIFWLARIVAAIIMLQTLYFKFTAAEESVYIFTQVGMEPWGRIGVGVMELLAAILILLPSTVWLGGTLAAGLMGGALMMHLTLLGIEVKGDGGYLFFLALVVAICSIVAFWIDRKNIPAPIKKFLPSFLH
ncbi:MAG: DoxX family protein [Cyclobacteriaceae bacterium]|nr:DoxX family protein [Cyclobacteriaceae bacterium]